MYGDPVTNLMTTLFVSWISLGCLTLFICGSKGDKEKTVTVTVADNTANDSRVKKKHKKKKKRKKRGNQSSGSVEPEVHISLKGQLTKEDAEIPESRSSAERHKNDEEMVVADLKSKQAGVLPPIHDRPSRKGKQSDIGMRQQQLTPRHKESNNDPFNTTLET